MRYVWQNVAVLKHMKVMHPPLSMENKIAPSPIINKNGALPY